MRPRLTSASLMRDILAGLCEARAHKSLGCATPSGCENRVVRTRNSASAKPNGLICCSNLAAISRPICSSSRHSKIPETGRSGMRCFRFWRLSSISSNWERSAIHLQSNYLIQYILSSEYIIRKYRLAIKNDTCHFLAMIDAQFSPAALAEARKAPPGDRSRANGCPYQCCNACFPARGIRPGKHRQGRVRGGGLDANHL